MSKEIDKRARELQVEQGLTVEAARSKAELELGEQPRAKSPAKRKPTEPVARPDTTEEQRRRIAERFTWRPGDIRVVKRGRGKR